MKEVILEKNKLIYEDWIGPTNEGAVSKEDFETKSSDYRSMRFSYYKSFYDLRGIDALIRDTTVKTHPIVQEAKNDTIFIAFPLFSQ